MIELLIALTLWHEAESESFHGRQMTATVIYNSIEQDRLLWTNRNDCIKAVILKPGRFSCWNTIDSIDQVELDLSARELESKQWEDCQVIAKELIEGTLEPLGDWTHYFAHNVCKPYWYKYMTHIVIVENHTFGKIKK